MFLIAIDVLNGFKVDSMNDKTSPLERELVEVRHIYLFFIKEEFQNALTKLFFFYQIIDKILNLRLVLLCTN